MPLWLFRKKEKVWGLTMSVSTTFSQGNLLSGQKLHRIALNMKNMHQAQE
jgi:hypothetical protein